MTDYNKLVKALRCCGLSKQCDSCEYGYRLSPDSECNDACDNERLDKDAAAAIEALQAEVDALVHDNERYIQFNTDLLNTKEVSKDEMDEILEYLRNAPVGPLEPMRIEQLPKRGEWIGKSDDDSLVKCSVCGHVRIGSSLWYCKQYVPYCENCGAKMEVQDGGD